MTRSDTGVGDGADVGGGRWYMGVPLTPLADAGRRDGCEFQGSLRADSRGIR